MARSAFTDDFFNAVKTTRVHFIACVAPPRGINRIGWGAKLLRLTGLASGQTDAIASAATLMIHALPYTMDNILVHSCHSRS